jgi:ArsR family transcriptional regulator
MNYIDAALICKALSDTNRLQIIQLLTEGEKCACKLLEHLK